MSSLDFSVEDYQELETKIVRAAQAMKNDGWWLNEEQQPGREKAMRTRLIWEMVKSVVQIPKPLTSFYFEIMQRKKDDHHASHSNLINQFFHLLSSSTFIFCYIFIFFNFTLAMLLGMAALFVRQFGHAILEPPCHDKEKALLRFQHSKQINYRGRLYPYSYRANSTVMEIWFLELGLAHCDPSFNCAPMVSVDTGGGFRTCPVSHLGA